MAPSHTPLPEGGALETITKQPNIIYENNPRQALSILSREYDQIYSKIIQLKPGTRHYEELKKQGQQNIQTREKLLKKILLTTEVPK
jgi:hypothetical protein